MNKIDAAKLADEIGRLRTEKSDLERAIKAKQETLMGYFRDRGILMIEGDHFRAKQQDSKSDVWNPLAIEAVAARVNVPLETLKKTTEFSFIRTDALRKS